MRIETAVGCLIVMAYLLVRFSPYLLAGYVVVHFICKWW